MRPLDEIRALIAQNDVVIMPLEWKYYEPEDAAHPPAIPYLMVGAIGYNRRFLDIYNAYLEDLKPLLPRIAMPDQYLVSLLCLRESERLRIYHHHTLQLDVINMEQELGDDGLRLREGWLDLNWDRLRDFHVFHYNEYKPQYMRQIRETWGLPVKRLGGGAVGQLGGESEGGG